MEFCFRNWLVNQNQYSFFIFKYSFLKLGTSRFIIGPSFFKLDSPFFFFFLFLNWCESPEFLYRSWTGNILSSAFKSNQTIKNFNPSMNQIINNLFELVKDYKYQGCEITPKDEIRSHPGKQVDPYTVHYWSATVTKTSTVRPRKFQSKNTCSMLTHVQCISSGCKLVIR